MNTPPSRSGTWMFHYSGNRRSDGLLVTRGYRVNGSCEARALITSAGYALEDFEDPRLMDGPKRIKTRVPSRKREAYTPRT